jgi:hypothetical protein
MTRSSSAHGPLISTRTGAPGPAALTDTEPARVAGEHAAAAAERRARWSARSGHLGAVRVQPDHRALPGAGHDADAVEVCWGRRHRCRRRCGSRPVASRLRSGGRRDGTQVAMLAHDAGLI